MASDPIARRIVRKCLRILSEIVPYNTKYRPTGIVNVSNNSTADDIEFIELNPPSRLSLDLTDAFAKDCSPYAKPIMTIDYAGDYIVAIPGGRIYAYDASNMAVISNANNLIEQVSFQWSNDVVLSGKNNVLFNF